MNIFKRNKPQKATEAAEAAKSKVELTGRVYTRELRAAICEKLKWPKNEPISEHVTAVLQALKEVVIEETTKGKAVELRGFGTWYPGSPGSRILRGRYYPAKTVLRFRAGSETRKE